MGNPIIWLCGAIACTAMQITAMAYGAGQDSLILFLGVLICWVGADVTRRSGGGTA